MRNRRRTGSILLGATALALVATLSIPLLAIGTEGGGSSATVGCRSDATSPTILGPSSMSVPDLTDWWASTGRGQPRSLAADIDDVIALYVTVGDAEGVRGDMALAQAVLETGHFTSADTARNNFAGMGHADGQSAGMSFPNVSTGVRAHIQLLKKYAAGNDTPLAGPDVVPAAGASASTWDELATRWASAADYGTRLAGVYEAIAASASSARTVPASSLPCSPDQGSVSPAGADQPGVQLATVRGITVHASLAGQLEALLAAAEADGLRLTGWGYRSHERQIELRREHCGTSHYAVYEMPSSQCSPPTARPGSSQHERGLAIDFSCNGGLIGSRSSACFTWMQANAGRYGLRNLPSEPWHWSVDGT